MTDETKRKTLAELFYSDDDTALADPRHDEDAFYDTPWGTTWEVRYGAFAEKSFGTVVKIVIGKKPDCEGVWVITQAGYYSEDLGVHSCRQLVGQPELMESDDPDKLIKSAEDFVRRVIDGMERDLIE